LEPDIAYDLDLSHPAKLHSFPCAVDVGAVALRKRAVAHQTAFREVYGHGEAMDRLARQSKSGDDADKRALLVEPTTTFNSIFSVRQQLFNEAKNDIQIARHTRINRSNH